MNSTCAKKYLLPEILTLAVQLLILKKEKNFQKIKMTIDTL